jgi:hypothetical protein
VLLKICIHPQNLTQDCTTRPATADDGNHNIVRQVKASASQDSGESRQGRVKVVASQHSSESRQQRRVKAVATRQGSGESRRCEFRQRRVNAAASQRSGESTQRRVKAAGSNQGSRGESRQQGLVTAAVASEGGVSQGSGATTADQPQRFFACRRDLSTLWVSRGKTRFHQSSRQNVIRDLCS